MKERKEQEQTELKVIITKELEDEFDSYSENLLSDEEIEGVSGGSSGDSREAGSVNKDPEFLAESIYGKAFLSAFHDE